MLLKVRKNIIKKAIIKIVVCIAIIIGTLIYTDMGPIKFVMGPENINIDNIDLDKYAGKYVEADIAYIYDYFLEVESYTEYKDGTRTNVKTTSRYYITDVNLSQYLALLADGSNLMYEFDVLLDNTGIALDNNLEPTASSYRGTFVKLSAREYSELKSFMTQVGLTEDMYSDYVFKVNYAGKFNITYAIMGCGVIIFAALFALMSLIRALSDRYAKDVKKFAVDNGLTFEQLCMELDRAYETSNIWITDRYTAYIRGNKIRVLKNADYIWAYYKETRSTRRGVTTTTRQIALADRNKKFTLITVASEEVARNILGIYAETQPQIVLGFNEDLQNLFRTNFDQFLMLPYQNARSEEETAPSEEYVPEEYVREGYVPEEYVPESYETSEQKNDNNF